MAPVDVPPCTLEEVVTGGEFALAAETEKPNCSKFIATGHVYGGACAN